MLVTKMLIQYLFPNKFQILNLITNLTQSSMRTIETQNQINVNNLT